MRNLKRLDYGVIIVLAILIPLVALLCLNAYYYGQKVALIECQEWVAKTKAQIEKSAEAPKETQESNTKELPPTVMVWFKVPEGNWLCLSRRENEEGVKFFLGSLTTAIGDTPAA